MFQRIDAVKAIEKGVEEKLNALGFESLGVTEDTECVRADFNKTDITLRLESHDSVMDVLEKAGDGDFNKISTLLLELSSADDRDIKSVCSEIIDTADENYSAKSIAAKPRKIQKTVSRSDVRAGMSYDANTLASKIVLIYPELRGEYNANVEKYGQFLGEDFFVNHANACILSTVKNGDSATRKKLFKILVDMYQNGSTDTQNLICVTILGEMNNDKDMMEVCASYIDDDDFYDTLKAVNELLSSGSGKKYRAKLKNPPKYKPGKKKKSFMANMLDAGAMQQQ